MSEASVLRKAQSSTSGHTQMTSRQPYMSEPIASKHVCFYKSGDAQFSGLPVVINSRTFKTFEGLLDSLSKRVPLPFGVRTITTPRGHTAVRSLDQLHHGHSYICSDQRTVKPIDLERARRKLPPWYHARPVSARRLAWQTRSPAPRGTRRARRNEHAALLHTPKRLVVFRNGEPEVKHTLMLQKRTTQSFEALLQHMSDVMTFPVLRLYTPEGRRVDGLPALILCSGVLVAAGREPFRQRNYDIQKTSPPTWLPAKRMERQYSTERKKKSSSTKSHPFSPSSERYVVEQINNSITGSMCDFQSNLAVSLEIESGQPLESVAETDTACLDEDDIEKSFRVNQDGSMTVEMKVRLTIKEEETINWTTTVSRSSVANQIKVLSDPSPDLDAHLSPLDDPVTIQVDKSNPEDNSHLSPVKNIESKEQSEINRDAVSTDQPSSPQTQSPGLHKVQQKQTSAESIRTITDTEIQENSSYSYKEQLDNGEMMEKYCMVHCSRPVPKPRGTLPSEMNTTTTTQLQSRSYSASEVLRLQENGKEVRETVLHIYEQQTCQENLSGNMQLDLQGFGTSPDGSPHGHLASSDASPVTSDKTFCSSSADMELKTLASHKQQSTVKQLSSTHKPNISKADTASTQRTKKPAPRSTQISVSQKAPLTKRISTTVITSKRKPVRVIVKKNYLLNTANPKRKQKNSKEDILKEIRKIRADLLKQTGAMKLKEHIRAKAVEKLLKQRKNTESVPLKPQGQKSECSDSLKTQDPNLVDSHLKECPTKALPKTKILLYASQLGTPTRQTSMQEESDCQGQTQEFSQSKSLAVDPSLFSLKNEYVELWLQKSQPPLPDEELLTTIKPQKSIFHHGTGQELSTEVTKIAEDGKYEDKGSKDLISNQDHVLRNTVSANYSSINATSSSSLNGHLLTKNSSATPLPQNLFLKEFSNPVNSTIKTNLSATRSSLETADKDNLEDSPFTKYTLQGTSLPSQASIETIPKNNTMVKASLFNNQPVEKTPLLTKKVFDKKGTLKDPLQMKKSGQEKEQENSDDTIKTREDQQISELKSKTSSYDTENCTLLDISSEQRDLQADKFYTVKMAVSPDMKSVLDQLCQSLQSLCAITQQQRPSCLQRSKSVPDFSSHLASTFGSSSRILIAFLSIMTLKDGLQHLNAHCQAESHLGCSEAMIMLQSLKELTRTEDPDQLRKRLTDLHASASIQLLQRWRGFQELSNKTKSHSITPDTNESYYRSSSEEEEQAIQVLMEDLGVPERVRDELKVIFNIKETCNQFENMKRVSDSFLEVKENGFSKHLTLDCVLEDYGNLYVSSVIDRAVNAHTQENSTSQIFMAEPLLTPDTETIVKTDRHQKDLFNENTTEEHNSMGDSVICDNMPSIESSFGMEIHKEMDLKKIEVQEMKEIRLKKQEDETIKKHQKGEEEMGIERHKGIDEDRGTLEENNPAVENYESQKKGTRQVATDKEIDHLFASPVCYEEKPTFCEDESFNEEGEYENCDERLLCFSEERSFNDVDNLSVKCPITKNRAEQTCSETEISGHWQSQSQSHIVQTKVQLHKDTTTDIWIPDQQGISHVFDINMEVDTINYSNKQEDFCMEDMSSDEEHVIIETPECYTVYQQLPQDVSKYKEKEIDFIVETSNSVKNLISTLKDEERSVPYKTHQMSGKKLLNHIHVTTVETPKKTKTTDRTSLEFDYDTKSLARDPEANIQINRVKSIREMFLAKSNANMQSGQIRLTSSRSDPPDHQLKSMDSIGHQSSTSPELSKDEEDACRLAITKGYVKRTIERLYGKDFKKVASATHKEKKREGHKGKNVTNLSSIHEAHTNVISDLSYFNATSSIEGFNNPTNCVTLKTCVGPKDAILIDKGRWLLRDNQTSLRSSPQPEETCKNDKEKVVMVESEQDCEKEGAPYSLFGLMTPDKVSDQEEHAGSTETTFTYFHPSNACDFEMETDNTEHAKKVTENKMTPQSNKGWTEKHGILTVFSLPDIKKANKVQPMMEATPPVVTQPTKRPGVQTEVTKRSTEPDALEILYMFCGQHCPLL